MLECCRVRLDHVTVHAPAHPQAFNLLMDPAGAMSAMHGRSVPWQSILWTGLASTDLALLIEVRLSFCLSFCLDCSPSCGRGWLPVGATDLTLLDKMRFCPFRLDSSPCLWTVSGPHRPGAAD